MSQHSLSIANQAFPATRTDLNNALQALGSLESGASAPGTTYAYMWWADTTNGVLKQRDSTNASWQIRNTLAVGTALTPSKTTGYTTTLADSFKCFLCSSSGGAFTMAIISAATYGAGVQITFKKTDSSSNAVILDPAGAETIDGSATLSITTQYDAVTLESDGTNWQRVSPKGTTSMTLIQTQSVSGAASVDFTSGITSAYSHYILDGNNISSSSANDSLLARVYQGGWISSGSYDYCGVKFPSTSLAAAAQTSINIISGDIKASGAQAAVFEFFRPELSVPLACLFRAKGRINGGAIQATVGAAEVVLSAPTTGVQMLMATGNITGTFNLWGLP